MDLKTVTKAYEDIIFQEPELVIATFTQDQIDLLKNPRYLSLVKIIHERRAVTLTELSETYTKLAKSSIHRYLTTLKQHNIVQEAGKRIIEGQFQSQTLYSLTARYIIIDEPEINWEGNEGKRIFQEIVKILKILYPEKSIVEETLYQWQLQFQHIVDANKQRLIKSNDPEILEILSVWAPWTINSIIEDMGFVSALLTDPNAQKNFLNCFNTFSEGETSSMSSYKEQSTKPTNKKYKDVIRQYPQIRCVILPNDPRKQYFENPAYIPLIHILRDGPITIKDLVKQYNQIATGTKTRSTIYRYINTLKRANLVIEVGKRVIRGKKAVQTLYAPIARWFTFYDTPSSKWESDKGKRRDAILKMLKFLHPELPKVNKKCIHEFLLSTWEYVVEAYSKLSSQENRKMFELLHTYNWNDFYVTISTFLDYYSFMNMPNMHERLMKCYSE